MRGHIFDCEREGERTMRARAFELVPGGVLTALDVDEAIERRRTGDGSFWFDVDGYDVGEIEVWLQRLEMPRLVTLLATGRGPLDLISLPRSAYLGVTVFADETGDRLEAARAIVSTDTLVTFHPEQLAMDAPAQEILDEVDTVDLSPSRLLVLLMLVQVQHTRRVAMALWDAQSRLDAQLDDDVRNVEYEQVREQKMAVARLSEVAESQTECFEFLAGAESEDLDFTRHVGNIAQLVAAARSMRRLAERLDEAANDLRRNRELNQQRKMTHRLNILTVITAIFTPLTLMAGIWGMNFENMPGLTTTYGYAIALGMMVVIAVVLLRYFRREGWFD